MSYIFVTYLDRIVEYFKIGYMISLSWHYAINKKGYDLGVYYMYQDQYLLLIRTIHLINK